MSDSWNSEFKCWNTDPSVLSEKRFCEICGANKPVELHELWCPNEPDRLTKDDPEFWYDNAECDECECEFCFGGGEPHNTAIADGLNSSYVPPARNPAFDALLEQMRDIHNRKNKDYAEEGNPYSNFELAAKVGGCSVDTVFRTLIGVKLARLDELLKGKTANFESIADTRLDLAVYAALWASYGK